MKHEVRKYKMSDARLIQLAENLKNSDVRDLNDLKEHGVSPDTLNDLQKAIFNFIKKPTDEELSAKIIEVAQNGNFNNPIFMKYGIDLLNRQGTDEMVRKSRMVQFMYSEQLPELSTEGITNDMLERLGSVNANFDNSRDSRSMKNRNIAVYDRVFSGNSLYAMMITMATKGKLCCLDFSERRYNDHIAAENYINNWQCTDGNIGPYSILNVGVTCVSDSTVFTLTNNSNAPLIFFFAPNPKDTSGARQVTMAPGNSQTYISAALGFDVKSMNTKLNILNGSALPGSYMVEWL